MTSYGDGITIEETRLCGECERCHADADYLYEIDRDAGGWLYCEPCTQTVARRDCIAQGDHAGDLNRACRRCSLSAVLA